MQQVSAVAVKARSTKGGFARCKILRWTSSLFGGRSTARLCGALSPAPVRGASCSALRSRCAVCRAESGCDEVIPANLALARSEWDS